MRLPLVLMMILLAFPVLEWVLLAKLATLYGWWVLVYVLFSALLGWLLIKSERLIVFARLFQSLNSGELPWFALLSSARILMAGALLIFPGVISDLMALFLLLLPISLLRQRPLARQDDNVIEAEWRRED